jgi:ABC transporter
VGELIDLAGDAGTRIGQLSGGQRRRVAVGLGIIGRPELLFLDEPTTGLDPAARRQAWTTVERLCADGTTMLLTTHYLEEAQQLADRVLVLSRGRLVADARPDELRGRGRLTRVRYPLPPGAPTADLPPALAAGADPDAGELAVHTDEVAATLAALVAWAGRHRIDLADLEVGPRAWRRPTWTWWAPRPTPTRRSPPMPEPTPARLAGPLPVLAGPLRYQLLLLARNPNALMAGVVLPVLLLVPAGSQQARLPVATLAGRVVLGVTLLAYLTHAAPLVAAREAGVLKRWPGRASAPRSPPSSPRPRRPSRCCRSATSR